MQQEEYSEAFELVMAEARKISGISDLERSEAYEALKGKIYEMLREGRTDLHEIANEAISWLRQTVQIEQSKKRVTE